MKKEKGYSTGELKRMLAEEKQKLIADLVAEGSMTGPEISVYIDTIFDWDLRGAMGSQLTPREDEFAESEIQRYQDADNRRDSCYVWLCLRTGGAADDILVKFADECASCDYEQALYWVLLNDLMMCFMGGDTKVRSENLDGLTSD